MGIYNFRPEDYEFPIGLSTLVGSGGLANAATNATGGTQTVVGSNAIHAFTTSGTFTAQYDLTIDYLCIAGGGGGGGHGGGAGGAGGYRNSCPGELTGGGGSAETSLTVPAGTSLSVVIGGGGNGGGNADGVKGGETSITGTGIGIYSEEWWLWKWT